MIKMENTVVNKDTASTIAGGKMAHSVIRFTGTIVLMILFRILYLGELTYWIERLSS